MRVNRWRQTRRKWTRYKRKLHQKRSRVLLSISHSKRLWITRSARHCVTEKTQTHRVKRTVQNQETKTSFCQRNTRINLTSCTRKTYWCYRKVKGNRGDEGKASKRVEKDWWYSPRHRRVDDGESRTCWRKSGGVGGFITPQLLRYMWAGRLMEGLNGEIFWETVSPRIKARIAKAVNICEIYKLLWIQSYHSLFVASLKFWVQHFLKSCYRGSRYKPGSSLPRTGSYSCPYT